MSEQNPNLDDLIAREKQAWADRAPPTDANLTRLHASLDAPTSPLMKGPIPYVAVAIVVVLGSLAAFRLRASTHEPHREPARTHQPAAAARPASAPAPIRPPAPTPAIPSSTSQPGTIEEPTPATAPRTATRRDAGPSVANDGLARELSLLREAQLALRSGDPARAIELAETHAQEFPMGTLAPERRAVERRARCVVEHRASGEPEDTCR